MRTKKQKQSKLMKIVSTPLRVLGKARDLYVKSITGCATRTYGHSRSMPKGELPKSYSMGSTISSASAGDDYGDLIRAASVRSLGHKNEIDMLLQQHKEEQQKKQLPKSVSVGMGFMGRIDEENGDEEGSVGGSKRADMYPRSRTVAGRSSGAAF
ncbi:uncharacterized protein LOC126677434 [Mercurialis annua]|uniref:uncharacterized protein LOC126677434 n=1 Tax=Mercurialis annua TaxID=3986 RepID=UPI00215FA8C9|nr:uncharacterized protein LOC126677434 [Mercurialis annua]